MSRLVVVTRSVSAGNGTKLFCPTTLAKSAKGKLPLKTVADYAKALESMDNKDPKKAKQQLEEVVKANPDFMLARLGLAELAL